MSKSVKSETLPEGKGGGGRVVLFCSLSFKETSNSFILLLSNSIYLSLAVTIS